ncbi:MAG: hypothetical protein H6658_01870 [Ardenticatenaceae bacterium]|nr:hypothetical protein [Ardenticatenaceae bacterium]
MPRLRVVSPNGSGRARQAGEEVLVIRQEPPRLSRPYDIVLVFGVREGCRPNGRSPRTFRQNGRSPTLLLPVTCGQKRPRNFLTTIPIMILFWRGFR